MNKKKLVQHTIFLALLSFYSFVSSAQTLPAFQMKLSNGKIFSSSEISHKKPLILIYFAPDCEHCEALMKQIFSQINTFKNTELVLVTFEPLQVLPAFEKEFQTAKYPNIKVGSEVKVLYLQKYYQLQHTPFTALFDKNGKLIVSYKDYTPLNDLIKKLKALEKK
ncbi:MAG TPA: thioredoxin-like domain-containing protein [Hanamia sp.]|nr:thioredoxin-like domain-containing protein [Hanamia sp.]